MSLSALAAARSHSESMTTAIRLREVMCITPVCANHRSTNSAVSYCCLDSDSRSISR